MGACTSKSEVLKNIAGEDFPVEKEEEEVVVKDASVVEDSEAKRQSLDNLLNQNDEEKVSAEKPSSEQENVKPPQEFEPPVNADEAEVVLKNKASEENNVEAEEVTKAETSEEKNNVVAEEAEVMKTESPEESKEAEEKNDKTEVESETSEANKTEEKKEDAKPLFKLWF